MISINDLQKTVATALLEDIGSGDITAALLPKGKKSVGQIISREEAVICGSPWVNEVFKQLDPTINIDWLVKEGEWVKANTILCKLTGPTASLLTGERTALNFLQTLSGTASITHQFMTALSNTKVKLLDTRKTIPGLRLAQKYAVRCGGGTNHRLGLYDAFLIKENHILACGSIKQAITLAREKHPEKKIEIEVENLEELKEALDTGADIIMLDNFDIKLMEQAVKITAGRAKLEVSGNVSVEQLQGIATTGVDFVSVGALTKHVKAVDLSMRLLD